MLLTHTHALTHTHSTCLPTRSHNHIFIHTHSHVCTLTHANTCLHTYAHTFMQSHTYTHSRVLTLLTFMCSCIYTRMRTPRYPHSNTCWLMSGHSPTHIHPHSLTPLNAHTQHVHSPTRSHPASQDQLCGHSRGNWGWGGGEGPLCWLPDIPQGRRPGLGKFQSLRPADSALLSLAA